MQNQEQEKVIKIYCYGRRRINLAGPSSYVIRLPKAWVDKVGVTAGDFVDLTSRGRDLIVSPVREGDGAGDGGQQD